MSHKKFNEHIPKLTNEKLTDSKRDKKRKLQTTYNTNILP